MTWPSVFRFVLLNEVPPMKNEVVAFTGGQEFSGGRRGACHYVLLFSYGSSLARGHTAYTPYKIQAADTTHCNIHSSNAACQVFS